MWDADDDNLDSNEAATHLSKSSGFSLDDAFSEDDGVLDAALEFNPAAIRAALARTLAAEASESAKSHGGVEDDGGSSGPGSSDLKSSNHDRNGSVKSEDPDASVSTLDINAPPTRAPGRAPEEWSRSTSYGHGYGYRQDSQDTGGSGVESLASFSRISLSDSVHDLGSVEESLRPSEGKVEEGHGGFFRTVCIDLSQGEKPRVEEVATALPELSSPRTPDRDETRMSSPKPMLSPPSLQSASNDHHNAHISPLASTPTSNVFHNPQIQSQSVPELPPQTTYLRPSEDDHITQDSASTVLSSSSLGNASTTTTSEPVPTRNSTTSPPTFLRTEPSRPSAHRHSRSVGKSTLDKVVSRTRPTFLPPKPKTEDLKHLADWEAMMKQSRSAGESHFYPLVRSIRCLFFHGSGGSKHIDLQLFFCPPVNLS